MCAHTFPNDSTRTANFFFLQKVESLEKNIEEHCQINIRKLWSALVSAVGMYDFLMQRSNQLPDIKSPKINALPHLPMVSELRKLTNHNILTYHDAVISCIVFWLK